MDEPAMSAADPAAAPAAPRPRIELPPLPADAVPIVPIRSVALFPGAVVPIALAREQSIAAAQEAVRAGRKIALLAQRDPATEQPVATDLYNIGVLATVLRYVTTPEGAHHLICQGESRFRVVADAARDAVLRRAGGADPGACDRRCGDRGALHAAEAARAGSAGAAAAGATGAGSGSSRASTRRASWRTSSPTSWTSSPAEKQDILETVDLQGPGSTRSSQLLAHRVEVLKITRDINEQTQAALGERQREAVLREQLHQLQKELGESEDSEGDAGGARQADQRRRHAGGGRRARPQGAQAARRA